MFGIVIVILIYHRHKPIDITNIVVFQGKYSFIILISTAILPFASADPIFIRLILVLSFLLSFVLPNHIMPLAFSN
jgi:hypothetical protein